MLSRRIISARRGAAAIEFAVLAPLAMSMVLGCVDLARGYVVWEQTCNAAQAIAEAAEKLSVKPGATTTILNATQMQAAMSLVYADVTGMSLGNGTSTTASSFQVTLSGVVYSPLCSTASGCAAQTPYTAWSSYLSQSGVSFTTAPLRPCGALTAVASFPDDNTQLSKMVTWTAKAGSGNVPMTPQVVADVRTTFVPIFSVFMSTMVFWASATMPAPLGATNQVIGFDSTAPTGNVQTCTVPS
jgi:Flp pilus assembly protein TadG